MMPSNTTESEDNNTTNEGNHSFGIMDKLAAAFRSTSVTRTASADKERVPKSSRSSRLNSNNNNNNNSNTSSTTPSLRKRSSGSISFYRSSSQENGETRRRDSNGINYTNFVSALNEYQQQQKQQQSSPSINTEQPLFTVVRRDEPSPIKIKSPTPPPLTSASSSSSSPLVAPASPRNSINSNNKGRVAKRLSATLNTIINPIHSNPHGSNTGGALSKTIKETKPIEPSELADMLDQAESPLYVEPLMIDMRSLESYEKSRIRHSINVNLPSLLIKRYRRGVVSNFNLESFITTPEGTDYFKRWMERFNVQDIQNLPEGARFIVYDDDMMMNEDTAVWTLMGVIAKNLAVSSNVNWLKDGFIAFEKYDFTAKYLSGAQFSNHTPIPDNNNNSTLKKNALLFKNSQQQQDLKLKMPTPMISRSATTLSSKTHHPGVVNVQRRASLFSLDTTTLRSKNRINTNHNNNNNINISAMGGGVAQRRLEDMKKNDNTLASINERSTLFSPTTPATAASSPDVFHTPLEQLPSALPTEETGGDVTPKTEGEFDFVISEIIPNFLYLGPELVNTDQVSGLKSRSIKRILNMAEECDDDVPGLKDTFLYQKIAARDTVEMQNVEGTLRKAVQVIDDSKKHHEPIYVHCKAGKSRSAAAILAYLVLSEHWTLKRAYRHIVKARPNISPNIGFVAELMKLEEGVHGEVSNFAGTDWHLNDLTNPPSPDTQKEMGRLEKAWKRGRSQSGSRHRSLSGSSRGNMAFSSEDK